MNAPPPIAPMFTSLRNGRVAIDLPCTRCAYSLLGADASGACPECNHPVAESIPPTHLLTLGERTLAAMHMGAVLGLTGTVLLMLAVGITWSETLLPRRSVTFDVEWLLEMLGAIALAPLAVAAWETLVTPRGGASTPPAIAARRRMSVVSSVLVSVLLLIVLVVAAPLLLPIVVIVMVLLCCALIKIGCVLRDFGRPRLGLLSVGVPFLQFSSFLCAVMLVLIFLGHPTAWHAIFGLVLTSLAAQAFVFDGLRRSLTPLRRTARLCAQLPAGQTAPPGEQSRQTPAPPAEPHPG